MKKNYFIIALFICLVSNAQVGIGTVEPQRELHIAGENSTIRIAKLDVVNSSDYNDGIKPAPAFVNGYGDIVLGNEPGTTYVEPINFLIIIDNFITDNPYGYNVPDEVNDTGVVINNDFTESLVTEEIVSYQFTVPQDALIEVKYGVTLFAKGEDMSAHPPPFFDVTYNQAISMVAFFCIDMDNNGIIDALEYSNKYGIKGQYFETNYGGIHGYPYMNGHGYLSLSAGDYGIHFFGEISDFINSYTSVGFGGKEDYLKIRIFN